MLWETVQNTLNKQSISYKNDGVEPTFNNMEKIADALNVSLDEFRSDRKKWIQ